MEFVSTEYEARLTRLADLLCTPDRIKIIQQEVQLELGE